MPKKRKYSMGCRCQAEANPQNVQRANRTPGRLEEFEVTDLFVRLRATIHSARQRLCTMPCVHLTTFA